MADADTIHVVKVRVQQLSRPHLSTVLTLRVWSENIKIMFDLFCQQLMHLSLQTDHAAFDENRSMRAGRRVCTEVALSVTSFIKCPTRVDRFSTTYPSVEAKL